MGEATWLVSDSWRVDPPEPSVESIIFERLTRFGCAAVLLAAASLKLYQVVTDVRLGVIYGSRVVEVALAEYEFLLAAWLLSGIGSRLARTVALLTFVAFAAYSCYMGLRGEASCGCFGNIRVNPWWTFGLDLWLVLLLLSRRPNLTRLGLESRQRLFRLSVATGAFLIFTAGSLLLSMMRPPLLQSSEGVSVARSNFVLLEPEKWVGRAFPLHEDIELRDSERLQRGSWVLLFYHADCPTCRRVIGQYERLAAKYKNASKPIEIALIEVPAAALGERLTCKISHISRLSANKEWIIKTPSEVRMIDGHVIAATSEEEGFLTKALPPTD
jgi:hypothetical protein